MCNAQTRGQPAGRYCHDRVYHVGKPAVHRLQPVKRDVGATDKRVFHTVCHLHQPTNDRIPLRAVVVMVLLDDDRVRASSTRDGKRVATLGLHLRRAVNDRWVGRAAVIDDDRLGTRALNPLALHFATSRKVSDEEASGKHVVVCSACVLEYACYDSIHVLVHESKSGTRLGRVPSVCTMACAR